MRKEQSATGESLTDAEMITGFRRWLSSTKETAIERRWMLRACTLAEKYLLAEKRQTTVSETPRSAVVESLVGQLRKPVSHNVCEDAWYSCSQADCADDRRTGQPCDCGAQRLNELHAHAADALERTVSATLLKQEQVEWVVNDIAELGVKIGDQFFWLYKGHSLIYGSDEDFGHDRGVCTHDNGTPMHWRPVGKREFGECCHPVNYKEPSKWGTVSLNDSDEWKPLPAARPA